MRTRKLQQQTIVWISVLLASWSFAQEVEIESEDEWLPARCVPLDTIGFHDEAEATSEPQEVYEIVQFSSTPFVLRENETLVQLLGDVDESILYLTLEVPDESEFFELTCRPVIGASREPGFSCVNTPPADMLLLNPKSMRFSRAAIGSWTFQSQSDLERGSSLFVQLGQCYSLDSEADSDSS